MKYHARKQKVLMRMRV